MNKQQLLTDFIDGGRRMTPEEFFELLSKQEEPVAVTLSPGPFSVVVGESDVDAARFLLKVYREWQEEKMGTVERRIINSILYRASEMLDEEGFVDMNKLMDDRTFNGLMTSWWWLVFWSSAHKAESEQ